MRKWKTLLGIVLLMLLPLVAHGQTSTNAQDQPSNVLAQYAAATNQWVTIAQGYANRLFTLLATIDISWLGIIMLLEGADMQQWLAKLMKKVAAIGFFGVLLEKGSTWIPAIITSFSQIGMAA